MEIKRKTLIVGLLAVMIVGLTIVGASSYYSMYDTHRNAMSSEDFQAMQNAMMNGDFDKAEAYHQDSNFECPMHELVVNGDVNLDDFATMHEWMMSGNFPEEKPDGMSDSLWELHKSHHPEIYG